MDDKQKPWPPPKSQHTLDGLKFIAEHDQFLTPPNSWPVSQTLAQQLHFRPRNVSAGDPEGRDD